MQIEIGYDFNNNKIITNRIDNLKPGENYEHNRDEDNLLLGLADMLGGKDFKIMKYAEDYTTLQYKGRDLCRLKYTPNTHWIRILMPSVLKPKYKDSILFIGEKNKNKVFWISHFGTSLGEQAKVLKDAMDFIDNDIKKES